MLSAVAKIYGKIIKFTSTFNENCLLIISNHQSGFLFSHSTVTALLEGTNSWSVNIDNGLLNGVIFIDLKMTFDTIDHHILLRKLPM